MPSLVGAAQVVDGNGVQGVWSLWEGLELHRTVESIGPSELTPQPSSDP